MEEKSNRVMLVKPYLPPYLTVTMTIGILAIEPSNTGAESSKPTVVEDRLNSALKYIAKGANNDQLAKHRANATVASISTLVFPFCVCIFSLIRPPSNLKYFS